MNQVVAFVVSLPKFVFVTKHIGPIGDPTVVLAGKKYGIMRLDKHNGRYSWNVFLGSRTFTLRDPGEQLSIEELDPETTRVTRNVVVNDREYCFHSGVRKEYYANYPKEVEVIPVWIPDARHAGDKYVTSMGISCKDGSLNDLAISLMEWQEFVDNPFEI